MTKTIYSPGMKIGPNNILFIREGGHKIAGKVSPRSVRLGVFLCPLCGKEFVTSINQITSGKTRSCGCLTELDLTNKRFGKLTALYKVPNKKDKVNNNFWHCICDCGIETDVRAVDLNLGKTKSCGCVHNLVGKRFGHLTVLKAYSRGKKNKSKTWICQCDCGQKVVIGTGHLISGHTQSCGCISSKGEEIIGNILLRLNITHIKQKTFEECKNPKTNTKLRFDFYLPDCNCCIEYDGKQHFILDNTGYYSDEDKFKERQYRDNIKNIFCENNNIKLVRIPYWDFDKIDEQYILDKIRQ